MHFGGIGGLLLFTDENKNSTTPWKVDTFQCLCLLLRVFAKYKRKLHEQRHTHRHTHTHSKPFIYIEGAGGKPHLWINWKIIENVIQGNNDTWMPPKRYKRQLQSMPL